VDDPAAAGCHSQLWHERLDDGALDRLCAQNLFLIVGDDLLAWDGRYLYIWQSGGYQTHYEKTYQQVKDELRRRTRKMGLLRQAWSYWRARPERVIRYFERHEAQQCAVSLTATGYPARTAT